MASRRNRMPFDFVEKPAGEAGIVNVWPLTVDVTGTVAWQSEVNSPQGNESRSAAGSPISPPWCSQTNDAGNSARGRLGSVTLGQVKTVPVIKTANPAAAIRPVGFISERFHFRAGTRTYCVPHVQVDHLTDELDMTVAEQEVHSSVMLTGGGIDSVEADRS